MKLILILFILTLKFISVRGKVEFNHNFIMSFIWKKRTPLCKVQRNPNNLKKYFTSGNVDNYFTSGGLSETMFRFGFNSSNVTNKNKPESNANTQPSFKIQMGIVLIRANAKLGYINH